MTLRPAGDPDIDQVLDHWQRAAENATRPPDSRAREGGDAQALRATATSRLPRRVTIVSCAASFTATRRVPSSLNVVTAGASLMACPRRTVCLGAVRESCKV
jgi:hypothetical protein